MFLLECLVRGGILGLLAGTIFGVIEGAYPGPLVLTLLPAYGLVILCLYAGFAAGLIAGLTAWLLNSLSGRRGEVFGWYLAGIAGGLLPLALYRGSERSAGFLNVVITHLPPIVGGILCAWAARRWPIPRGFDEPATHPKSGLRGLTDDRDDRGE